jgi:hypothetical protein
VLLNTFAKRYRQSNSPLPDALTTFVAGATFRCDFSTFFKDEVTPEPWLICENSAAAAGDPPAGPEDGAGAEFLVAVEKKEV